MASWAARARPSIGVHACMAHKMSNVFAKSPKPATPTPTRYFRNSTGSETMPDTRCTSGCGLCSRSRTSAVHRTFEAKGPSVCFRRSSLGEEHVSNRSPSAPAQPGRDAADQYVPPLCDQGQTGHAARGDQISNHCQRLAATKAIAVEPGGEFGETGRSVG